MVGIVRDAPEALLATTTGAGALASARITRPTVSRAGPAARVDTHLMRSTIGRSAHRTLVRRSRTHDHRGSGIRGRRVEVDQDPPTPGGRAYPCTGGRTGSVASKQRVRRRPGRAEPHQRFPGAQQLARTRLRTGGEGCGTRTPGPMRRATHIRVTPDRGSTVRSGGGGTTRSRVSEHQATALGTFHRTDPRRRTCADGQCGHGGAFRFPDVPSSFPQQRRGHLWLVS